MNFLDGSSLRFTFLEESPEFKEVVKEVVNLISIMFWNTWEYVTSTFQW